MANKLKIGICLFRNDVRYLDNEVLLSCHRNSDFVLPLYCFDPRHFAKTYHFEFPKTGPYRAKFLMESVEDLRATLLQHGSTLFVRRGKPEIVVPELIDQLGKENISGLFYQEEATQEELDVEEALKKSCDVPVRSYWGSTLFHKNDVPFKPANVPDVYTQFRKIVEGQARVRPCQEMPSKLRPVPTSMVGSEGSVPSVSELGVEEKGMDPRSAFPFQGGESQILDRLKKYLWETDQVTSYKQTRNGLVGSEYSTKFSAWLAHGNISPRQIYWEIKKYEEQKTANESTYWVIFELLWRDYFKFVAMKYGNRIFFPSGIMGKHVEWKKDKKLFTAWKDGQTGVPFVDANMRELACTGFMSNRGRQNVASFLTKDLVLDWRLGAEWFESMLIDHDVCSNYGNWLYSAGIGNDPRQDRKFNMVKQGLDYDPEGEYLRLWIPELNEVKGGDCHMPWTLNQGALARAQVTLGETYPQPVIIAPEWSRHKAKSASNSRGGRNSARGRGGQQRGMDFYFKGQGKGQPY